MFQNKFIKSLYLHDFYIKNVRKKTLLFFGNFTSRAPEDLGFQTSLFNWEMVFKIKIFK